MVATLMLLCLCIVFIRVLTRKKSRWEKLPPGPKGLPLIGNLLDLLFEEPALYYNRLSEKYGPIMSVQFGSKRVLILSSSEWVRKAFVDQAPKFADRPHGIALSYVTRGRGIVMSESAVNFHARRTLVRSFKHFGYGKNEIENIMDIEIESYLKNLKKSEMKRYSPRHDLAVSALNITWNMLSSERFDNDNSTVRWLIKTIGMTFELVKQGGFLNFTFILQFILTFLTPKALIVGLSVMSRFSLFKKSINTHHNKLDNLSRNQDFMYNFLEEQRKYRHDKEMENIFSDTQLSWILNDIFIASIETTVTSLRWALTVLVDRPDIQNQLSAEIMNVFGKSQKPSLSDREKMPQMEAFISEVLRAYPAIPILMHAASQDATLGDFFIPKGTWVMVNLWSCLMNKETWGDPENFRPSRFLDEDGNYVKNSNHIPFFIGRRNCIGGPLALAEMFLFLTNILKNYEVRKYDENKPWKTDIKFGLSLVPHDQEFKFVPKYK